jgi:hypothetical protein
MRVQVIAGIPSGFQLGVPDVDRSRIALPPYAGDKLSGRIAECDGNTKRGNRYDFAVDSCVVE